MSNQKKLPRRTRRAKFYLVAVLLLIALVLGLWILVLDDDAPFNSRLSRDTAVTTTPLPQGETAPESTDAAAPTESAKETAAPTIDAVASVAHAIRISERLIFILIYMSNGVFRDKT